MTRPPVDRPRRSTGAVLLLTADPALAEEVHRLAAAAGVSLSVAGSPEAALPGWAAAGAVLVGADLAGAVAEVRPPRHDEVHVVAWADAAQTAPLLRDALRLGARDVVELPAAATWLGEVLSDVTDGRGHDAHTLGVLAGSGGAGASTLATALALVAARAEPTLLLDLDPWGPGLDRVAGLDEEPGVRWDALATLRGRIGAASLRSSLPVRDRLALLTFGAGGTPAEEPEPGAVREVLAAAQRSAGRVVVDLPRGLSGAAEEVAARCDQVVLVCGDAVPAAASAARAAARLRALGAVAGLAVRTSNGALDPEQLAATLGLPLLTEYPTRRRVVEHVELGLGPVHGRRSALARAAGDVWGWAGVGGNLREAG